MFGRKTKIISEQAERIKQLEEQVAELTKAVDSFTVREHAISRAMTDAALQADRIVSDAQREAGEILEQSQANAESARKDSEQIVDTAYQNARDIVKEAEAESRRKLDETQEQIDSYASLLSGYDKLIQENIKTAEESARRFAELAGQLHASIPQIVSADGKLIGAAPDKQEEEKPEENAPQKPEESAESTAPEGKIWTVSEIAKDASSEDADVDSIITGILGEPDENEADQPGAGF